MGDGYFGPAREFAVRRADVQRLPAAARAAEELGRPAEYRGSEAGVNLRPRASRDSHQAVYGPGSMRQLRNLFGLWMPGTRAIQFRCHDASAGGEDRAL